MNLLGGLAPKTFLARHWQKRPMLVRQAIPGFRGIVSRDDLLALAGRDDVTSRLVVEHPRRKGKDHWERHHGPLAGLTAALLPRSHWTLLVHGLESLIPGGWEILKQFAFIPAARVDDLMVSYAAPGGSVGPHDDLYDVFLLQGEGRRRWQVSTRPHRRDETAAIKVLADFTPEDEWVLEPGDMLYLPPNVAHFGVAEGACFTYSIGFLAPAEDQLVESFLGFLAGALALDPERLYADPGLAPPRDPLEIPVALEAHVENILQGIRWDRGLVVEFLGCFLTRPGPRTVFHPPRRPMSLAAFARRLARGRVTLALPTRGLVRRGVIFLNGEAHRADRATLAAFKTLARDRSLALPVRLPDDAVALFHRWYGLGYLT